MFDPTGESIGIIGSLGADEGGLDTPGCLAIDKDDNLLVADRHNDRIQILSTEGTFSSILSNPF